MIETHEWVSTWWGYKEKIGTEAKQGNYFYSKPIFIFWSEAVACSVFGRSEFSIRLPIALLAITACFALYLALARIWGLRIGLLGTVVVATSPQYFMIARQAQTDMPFVATLVMALSAFMLALFGPREALEDDEAVRKRWLWRRALWIGLLLLLTTIPQYAIIITDLDDAVPAEAKGLAWLGHAIRTTGLIHVIGYASILAVALGSFGLSLRKELRTEGYSVDLIDRWWRKLMLVAFYVLIAQSTYAKGLLGFLLPGFIIGNYILWTNRWHLLKSVELLRGIAIFLAVGFPWYIAMFARHGNAYYQRFIIHDHIKRLGSGVHQIDSGTFEHFIKWLAYGMWPWVAFVPLTIGGLLWLSTKAQSHRKQATLFVAFWFVCAFALFTLSSTKFHHYIFPALPALGVLITLFLAELLTDTKSWMPRIAALFGIALHLAVANDITADQQQIRKLMTYKYDRPMPQHLPLDPAAKVSNTKDTHDWQSGTFWKHSPPLLLNLLTSSTLKHENWMTWMTVLGCIALAGIFFGATRGYGIVGLALLATAMTMWSLNYYMPSLSPHWSQKYLFDSYYDTCDLTTNPEEIEDAYTPLLAKAGLPGAARWLGWQSKRVCREDILSWRITWRGETYYSYNELKPITKQENQFLPYLETMNGGKPLYAVIERGKMGSFKTKLNNNSDKLRRKQLDGWSDIERWDVALLHDESLYFQLIRADPVRDP
jgi:4-amino-4-deoxy-L-arabinose transferase-like glycosyltransferase